jgi:hypothetical protein
MFTFGIFSTHLPYVAVVAFYAYFLIFGVNKAANGEIENSEAGFMIELESNRSFESLNDDSNFYYQRDFDFYAHSYLERSIFKRKIKYQNSFIAETLQSGFYSTHFGRPPPAFV